MLNHKLIDIPPQEESPLAYADGVRRGDAMTLVRAALDQGNAALAFQPIVSAQNPRRHHFLRMTHPYTR